jgi:hypothetical protein
MLMKNNKKKFNIFSANFVGILTSIILIFLSFASLIIRAKFRNQSYIDYNEGIDYSINNIFLILIGIIFLFLTIFIIYKLIRKFQNKYLIIISLLLVTIFSIIYVNLVKAPVRADQKFVLSAAISFINGDFSLLDKPNYLYMHPLQLGIIFFIEILLKIFNSTSPLLIQNLNIIFVIISYFITYKITNLIYSNENTNKILLILLPLFLCFPMLCVLVYGNIFGFTFALLAIYALLAYYKNRKFRFLLISAISIIISIILKSNYEIIMIGIIITLVLDTIQKFDKKNIFVILLIILLFIGSNPIIYKIAEIRSSKTVNEGIPMISYVAMGISQPITRSAGWYGDILNVENLYSEANFDEEQTKQNSYAVIKDRLKEFGNSPKTFVKFYLDKILSTWCEPTFQTIWEAEPLDEFGNLTEEDQNYIQNNKLLLNIYSGNLNSILIYYLNVFEIIVFAFSSLSVIASIKNKTIDYQNFILIICFIGGFFFHILWETKCVYVIPFYFMLLPSTADGLNITFEFISKKIRFIKNKFTKNNQET